MAHFGIGVIGHGVVGQGVVCLLRERREALERASRATCELVAVAVRDPSRPRAHVARELLCTAEQLLANPKVDILVEVAGGVEGPFEWISAALRAGKKVVTANKAVLAERAIEVHRLLREHRGQLFFEAAVGGGIPIVQAIDRGLCANRVVQLEGILNGTCNYLLTLMERDGLAFGEALAQAQAKGFAEADPTLDIRGGDSAHKLAVLAGLVLDWPVTPAHVYTEGIDHLTTFDLAWAGENGLRVKMLAIARFGASGGEPIELRVHPTLVRRSQLISQVMDELNAVAIEGDLAGPQLYCGRGAGQLPTASAVLSDLVLAMSGGQMFFARPGPTTEPRFRPMGEVVTRHYVHLEVIDQPGVVARVASAFADRGISIASMYQPDVAHGSQVPVVFTTHPARDEQVAAALGHIQRQAFVAAAPVHIRMES